MALWKADMLSVIKKFSMLRKQVKGNFKTN